MSLGWWGFTFPLGVYSLSTILIGEALPSLFFRVLGTIFGTAVIVLWMIIAVRTGMGAWNGHLFRAPCLSNLKDEHRYPQDERLDLEENAAAMASSTQQGGVAHRVASAGDEKHHSTDSE